MRFQALGTVIIALFIPLSCSLKLKNGDCTVDTSKSLCSCVYDNGYALDLTPLKNVPGNLSTVSNTSIVYFYQPCYDIPLNKSEANATSALWMFQALKPSTANLDPLQVLNGTVNGTFTALATAEMATFEETNFQLNAAKIVYRNATVVSEVKLSCTDNNGGSLVIITPSPGVLHSLELKGDVACARAVGPLPTKHLSTGSVLLVLLFTFGLIYLVGGALLLKFLRGAEGLELIPNYEFWAELPSLVRDGVIFAMSCGHTRPDTYERI